MNVIAKNMLHKYKMLWRIDRINMFLLIFY